MGRKKLIKYLKTRYLRHPDISEDKCEQTLIYLRHIGHFLFTCRSNLHSWVFSPLLALQISKKWFAAYSLGGLRPQHIVSMYIYMGVSAYIYIYIDLVGRDCQILIPTKKGGYQFFNKTHYGGYGILRNWEIKIFRHTPRGS